MTSAAPIATGSQAARSISPATGATASRYMASTLPLTSRVANPLASPYRSINRASSAITIAPVVRSTTVNQNGPAP